MQQPVVTVNLMCDRTGKTSPVEVPLNLAETLMNSVAKKREVAETLTREFAKLGKTTLPDLVICFRGEVVVLPYVNPESDVVISRSLTAAVHKEGVFTFDPSQVKRKPRKVVKEGTDPKSADK